jgi:hypothetical protein
MPVAGSAQFSLISQKQAGCLFHKYPTKMVGFNLTETGRMPVPQMPNKDGVRE